MLHFKNSFYPVTFCRYGTLHIWHAVFETNSKRRISDSCHTAHTRKVISISPQTKTGYPSHTPDSSRSCIPSASQLSHSTRRFHVSTVSSSNQRSKGGDNSCRRERFPLHEPPEGRGMQIHPSRDVGRHRKWIFNGASGGRRVSQECSENECVPRKPPRFSAKRGSDNAPRLVLNYADILLQP